MSSAYAGMVSDLFAGKVITIPASVVASRQFVPSSLRVALSRERKLFAAAGLPKDTRRLTVKNCEDGSLKIWLEEEERKINYIVGGE